MNKITTEKAVQNQVASAKMEGFDFSDEAIEIIKRYADNKISHEELVEIVAQMCNPIS